MGLMHTYRATSHVTKKHKKAYRQSILAKMKDKNTKNIVEQNHNDGMYKYTATSNGYHQKQTKQLKINSIHKDK